MAADIDSRIPDADLESLTEAENLKNAILHPLATVDVEPQEWLNQIRFRHHSGLEFSLSAEGGRLQTVFLNESVYISESTTFSLENKCVLHVCSMKKQSYYKLPTQAEGYALAVYRSKVVIIGGEIPPSQYLGSSLASSDDLKYPQNPISVLDDDCGLEKRLNAPLQLPKNENIRRIGKNVCAVGDGDLLIVIGGDYPGGETRSHAYTSTYARVFNGQNWSYKLISMDLRDSTNVRSLRKTLLVFQNSIYMTTYDESSMRTKFYSISLERFIKRRRDSAKININILSWNQLKHVPECQCTNLSVMGNQLVTVGSVEGGFRMFTYLASSSIWIAAVHEFQTDANIYIAGIIGLQSSSSSSDQPAALVVGGDAHSHQTKIFKITTKSAPYNPDADVSSLSLSKLEDIANIPVLTAIEKNAEKFMDTAGFKLVYCFRDRKVRIACEYIKSWKMEKNHFYKPTWSGLLAVLRQIGLDSLATRIDGILKETSSPVEQLDERKEPENALELVIKLKQRLNRLSKKRVPKRLQKKVLACTNECDGVLQKIKSEKEHLEAALKSRDEAIEKLKSEVEFYRSVMRVREPTLKELVQFLFPVASKWYYIGLWIGVDENELDKIEADNQNECNMYLLKTLKTWLKMVKPKPSWSAVVAALKGIQEGKLAENISQTKFGHVTQPAS